MTQALYRGRRVLWMDPSGSAGAPEAAGAVSHCCETMATALVNDCEEHAEDAFACGDFLFVYSPTFDEYGVAIHDGGPSYLLIDHCPFCGAKLPESRRDDWFDALEALGVEDPFEEEIPERFRSAAWRLQTPPAS